ncbi:polar growth protein [Entomophthora muscae]|uniref:Polar growth protein n=1 Tax=Entomophthora muscae TaxID=34485 RepID=A0ACC2SXP7_9FUNG|nr:polar growth protein [Entomophthora muscae]
MLLLGLGIFLARRRRRVPVLEKGRRLMSPDSDMRRQITDFPFFARRDDEIHLNRDDQVVLFQEFDDGWAFGQNCRTGASGKFPLMCLQTGCGMQPISLNKADNTYRVIPKRSSSTLSIHLTSSIRSQQTLDYPPNSLGVEIAPSASYKFKQVPKIKTQSYNQSINSSSSGPSLFPLTPPPPFPLTPQPSPQHYLICH